MTVKHGKAWVTAYVFFPVVYNVWGENMGMSINNHFRIIAEGQGEKNRRIKQKRDSNLLSLVRN